MLARITLPAAIVAATAASGVAHAEQPLPDLSGSYRCEAAPSPCHASVFSIAQSGSRIQVKASDGQVAGGMLTSHMTVSLGPPWNLMGVIRGDGTIDWSTGTTWRRQ